MRQLEALAVCESINTSIVSTGAASLAADAVSARVWTPPPAGAAVSASVGPSACDAVPAAKDRAGDASAAPEREAADPTDELVAADPEAAAADGLDAGRAAFGVARAVVAVAVLKRNGYDAGLCGRAGVAMSPDATPRFVFINASVPAALTA